MAENDFHSELIVQMLRHVLGTIHAAMLSTCTTERHHEAGEIALDESLGMEIDQRIDMFEETQYLTVFLQEVYHGFVESCHVFVLDIASWIISTATVEHIPSPITALVLRHSVLVGEAEYLDHQRRPGCRFWVEMA